MAVSNGFLCSYLSLKLKLYYHDRIPLRASSLGSMIQHSYWYNRGKLHFTLTQKKATTV